MNSQPVMIKSSKNGINLVLDEKIPFEELLEQIKKIAGEKAEDYNKRFIESQERIAVEQAKRWQAENPFDETKESLDEYNKRLVAFVEDFIKQTPDEMLFNM